jgi:hypothetical protein
MRKRQLLAAACLAALTGAVPTSAHNPLAAEQADDLAQLVTRSALVVLGEVADVRYRNARNPDGGRPIPHAFVTFRVNKPLRGKVPGDVLVLRFVGGPDGQGGFLSVDGVPQFQRGDRDVLFVTGNGEQGCALALCEYGRYRVLENRVYNTHGAPVRAIVKDGAIARGEPPAALTTLRFPAPRFDDLLKNPAVQADLRRQNTNLDEARRRYEAEAPKEIEIVRQPPAKQAGTEGRDSGEGSGDVSPGTAKLPDGPVSLDAFTAKIVELDRRTPQASTAGFRNADPAAEIVLKAVAAARPSMRSPRRPVLVRQTAQELSEARALRAQDFDPVLKR